MHEQNNNGNMAYHYTIFIIAEKSIASAQKTSVISKCTIEARPHETSAYLPQRVFNWHARDCEKCEDFYDMSSRNRTFLKSVLKTQDNALNKGSLGH